MCKKCIFVLKPIGVSLALVAVWLVLSGGLQGLAAPAQSSAAPDANLSIAEPAIASGSTPSLVSGIQALAPESGIVYNSGWLNIAAGETITLTHNVGGSPDFYAVDLIFNDTDAGALGINQAGYGGDDEAGTLVGAYWSHLTAESIQITRQEHDTTADQVFVRVRTADLPDYDSGWLPIDAGMPSLQTLTHNLGGTPGDYLVGIKFRDTGTNGLGVNQYAFGGLESSGVYSGATWFNLTATSVSVLRFAGDQTADEYRLMIFLPDETNPPDYDSGWLPIGVGQLLVRTHGLGGNPTTYTVRMMYQSETHGINMFGAGSMELNDGDRRGLHWERLNINSIGIFRQANDIYGQQVRIRIWLAEAIRVYLPYIAR